MRFDLFKIFLVCAIGFGLAFASAPLFAFQALKAATAAEDVQATSDLVDFPAVRKSLTGQLAPDQVAGVEPPSIWQDPIGAFRKAIEPIVPPEPKVDRYLTLSGLSDLTRGYRPGGAPPPPPAAPETATDKLKAAVKGPLPGVPYWSIDRTRISVKRPGDPAKITVFTFERRALFTWKLAHIQLPQDER